ncbi:MAG TPA: CopL family metal-binding regulatory protein [Steroidobacter sp.]|uniref:CopL family metal-binding regulatory protein n=1 Tax=Steroidobacter sp. TaxID=1978227 RepID=UPI002ED9F206
MLLLVTRLFMGELGHAMPMGAMDVAEPAISAMEGDSAACPEHDSGSAEMPTAHHADASADHSSAKQDCCETGNCECPCLHVPCAALDAIILNPVAATSLLISHGTNGVISQRPSGLFRPPA